MSYDGLNCLNFNDLANSGNGVTSSQASCTNPCSTSATDPCKTGTDSKNVCVQPPGTCGKFICQCGATDYYSPLAPRPAS